MNINITKPDKFEGFYFTSYITKRIEKNKNFMMVITGGTGSGKTYSALRLCELLDSEFNEDRIVFTVEEFMELLNSGKLKKGSTILFDEAGVSMNNRAWQSIANQVIQFTLQTFRHNNYIVIFTAPDFGFVDSASKKLFHARVETQGINYQDNYCKLKPFMIQVNQKTGDIYFKYLIVAIAGVGLKKLKLLKVGLPNKKLIEYYEFKKTKFTTKLKEDLNEKLKQKEKGLGKQEEKYKQKYDELKYRNIELYKNSGYSWKEIGEKLNDSSEAVRKFYERYETKLEN